MTRRTQQSIVALVVLFAAVAARPAAADEVDDLIALVKSKPADLDDATWREKRRDAVRDLGNKGDKRAVSVLVEVVKAEEFDVVGELAIGALGKLGDDRAVAALQEVLADPGRDRDQKRAARRALKKLGASTRIKERRGKDDDDVTTSILGESSAPFGDAPEAPKFDDDLLGGVDRMRFAIGGARVEYDTIRKNPALTGDIRAIGERRRDYERWAYRLNGDIALAAGLVNGSDEDEAARSFNVNALFGGEARFYLDGPPVYGIGLASTRFGFLSTRVDIPSDMDLSENLVSFDLQLGLGAGFGRVLDKGEAIRLRRIEMVLRKESLLGRPITPDVAEKVLAAWYALRSEVGAYRRLVATVKILREAGVMLGEPTAGTAYEMTQVIRDGQLFARPSGFDAGIAIVESMVLRDDVVPVDDGRVESAVAYARFGRQSPDGENELLADGFARYRLLAGDGAPSPWAVGATATWRNYFYGDFFDSIGALEFKALVGAGNDDIADSDTGYNVGGSIGWLWLPNRASRFRVAGDVMLSAGEVFVGGTFEVAYGLLDAVYVGGAAIPAGPAAK